MALQYLPSCDSVIHRIFSYLEDVEDLSACQNVCIRWRYILHSHPSWSCCCIKTWNLPAAFKSFYENNEARRCCEAWICHHKKTKDSLFLSHFVSCFKSFCGGGEKEYYISCASIADDSLINHLRQKQFLTLLQEEVNDSSDEEQEDEDMAESSDNDDAFALEPISKEIIQSLPYFDLDSEGDKKIYHSSKPVFCHVDVSNLHSIQELPKEDIEIQSLSDLWLYTLHNQVRLVDHNRLVQPDVTAIKAYIRLFFDMVQKALMSVKDDELFLQMLFNILKKVNVFLNIVIAKGNYMQNVTQKNLWNELTTNLLKCWQSLPASHSKLFSRTLSIASSLIRDFYGNHKPDALIRCFEIFLILNPTAVSNSSVTPSSVNQSFGEPILKAYIAQVHQILNENVHLTSFKSTPAQFDHYFFLFSSFKQEDKFMKQYVLNSPLASTAFWRQYQARVLEQFIDMNSYLNQCVRFCYERYDSETFQMKDKPLFHYLDIPQELEAAFDGISLCRPGESGKFDRFMYTYNDQLLSIIHQIDGFVNPFKKNPAVQRLAQRATKLKRKREDTQQKQNKRKRT